MSLRDHAVLFVDDDANLLQAFRRQFRELACRTLYASSGHEALEILDRQPVSLIVSDQAMPIMSGLHLMRVVKARYPSIIRFILTGNATLDLAVEAINQGEVARFFVKPCSLPELAQAIQQALEKADKPPTMARPARDQAVHPSEYDKRTTGLMHVERSGDGAVLLGETGGNLRDFVRRMQQQDAGAQTATESPAANSPHTTESR
ncbi:MAG TPA: response regulator [Candidatus Sumerlaeota bacterium]|nr:response regulator [Candidatus Sumerlaeota bacterium]HOR28518.1 response regulator [Candidatus Sumerlaeota bacterium]HPK03078.1 response regulator [Candidatus Sumerlaeota bacterium]